MAFDHHVEADNVDLSFGSIMSRAPVIGSLMYLLGGRKACEEQEYESNTRKEMIDYAMAGSQCMTSEPNRPIKSALKKCSVSLIPTEYSEIGDSSSQLAVESDRMDSQLSFFPKKKELSWSDQSGQNLVEYIGPEQLSSSGPVGSSLAKSGFVGRGMTRSSSIRDQLEGNQMQTARSSRDKTYLPKISNQGATPMPSMHNHPQLTTSNGGIDSPQWGWYMTLTPPSPEMYVSHTLQKKGYNASCTSTASIASDASVPTRRSTKPNKIFQTLPSQMKDRSHSPSVPL